jgi:hypothetical protein
MLQPRRQQYGELFTKGKEVLVVKWSCFLFGRAKWIGILKWWIIRRNDSSLVLTTKLPRTKQSRPYCKRMGSDNDAAIRYEWNEEYDWNRFPHFIVIWHGGKHNKCNSNSSATYTNGQNVFLQRTKTVQTRSNWGNFKVEDWHRKPRRGCRYQPDWSVWERRFPHRCCWTFHSSGM